jgi:hypothetical protein
MTEVLTREKWNEKERLRSDREGFRSEDANRVFLRKIFL